MHALADAEVLEAWPARSVAPRVASRLAAADRIARGLLMLNSLLTLCVPAAQPLRRAILATAEMAAAAALFAAAPPRPHFATPERSVQAETGPPAAAAERFAAELRIMALLCAVSEAIEIMGANR